MISLPDVIVYGFILLWPGFGFLVGFALGWWWRMKP